MNGPPETKPPVRHHLPGQPGRTDPPEAPAMEPANYQKRQFAAESFRCKLCNRIMADGPPGASPAVGLCLLCTAEFGGQTNGIN